MIIALNFLALLSFGRNFLFFTHSRYLRVGEVPSRTHTNLRREAEGTQAYQTGSDPQ